MGRPTSSTIATLTPTSALLLLCLLYGFLWISLCSHHDHPELKGIDVGNPVVDVTPALVHGHPSSRGSKDVILCARVPVSGISRLKLQSYASAYRVSVVPSVVIPEKLHSKIQVCFHRNNSMGLCQCEKDDWKSLRNGLWTSTMSPYDQRFVDVKFSGDVSGSVSVTLDEVSQRWRYIFLVVGFALLFLAPIVSNWVPFYYSSSMAIGVLAVVLILLYQGMKLLPTGRKSAFYLTIYGSVLGAGSLLVQYLSMLLNSVLVNFGLSQEMQNPVSVFLLLGITILGAGLGYWLVRKYIISEDGDVDDGVAQFVKWAMRIIAVTLIFQSSVDTPLAMVAVGSCLALHYVITSINWKSHPTPSLSGNRSLWAKSGQSTPKHGRAEFLSRSKKISPLGSPWNAPRNSFAWSESPVKGVMVSPSNGRGSTGSQHDFYSTFHKTPSRKKFSKREWEEFTEESTREAVAAMTSTPEFTDWVIKNADRIKLLPDDTDEVDGSGSDSTDDNVVLSGSGNGNGLFNWQRRK